MYEFYSKKAPELNIIGKYGDFWFDFFGGGGGWFWKTLNCGPGFALEEGPDQKHLYE